MSIILLESGSATLLESGSALLGEAGAGGGPATPTGLIATTTVSVSWDATAGATGYRLSRVDDGGTAAIYEGAATTFLDTPDPGSSPAYTVAAYNAGGDSTQSAYATPGDLTPGSGGPILTIRSGTSVLNIRGGS